MGTCCGIRAMPATPLIASTLTAAPLVPRQDPVTLPLYSELTKTPTPGLVNTY
jgi:hypothetical protein